MVDAPVERTAEAAARQSRRWRDRGRDCLVLSLGAVGVLLILSLSGALGWVEAVTAAIVICAGTLAYYVGSTPSPDIHNTAIVQVRDAGIDEASTLNELIAILPLPALHLDPTGRIAAANAGARKVFRTERMKGQLASAAIRHPRLLKAIDTAERGTDGIVEIVTDPSADEIWVAHVSQRPGRSGGVVIVLEDRTSVRRAERARADFLANASHELRTPLTSLAGFIETMRGPAKDDKESWDRFLDIMFAQTERMRRLIADLLSLSRIEFSEHQAPSAREDLKDIIRIQAEALRPLASERSIEIEVDLPDHSLVVTAFRDELEQVVQNFLSNAVKYAPERGRVSITAGRETSLNLARDAAGRRVDGMARMTLLEPPADAQGAGVWLRVRDDGDGIDATHLPRLGERFYRVDAARQREVGGTGLGLAIVKHIMARHRGGMAVESGPGQGSAFGVWLPAADDAVTSPVTRM
ncbi:MAG: ATP-binding protein [Pseudomonadota bacterium]